LDSSRYLHEKYHPKCRFWMIKYTKHVHKKILHQYMWTYQHSTSIFHLFSEAFTNNKNRYPLIIYIRLKQQQSTIDYLYKTETSTINHHSDCLDRYRYRYPFRHNFQTKQTKQHNITQNKSSNFQHIGSCNWHLNFEFWIQHLCQLLLPFSFFVFCVLCFSLDIMV
jgi:hypothetical protein